MSTMGVSHDEVRRALESLQEMGLAETGGDDFWRLTPRGRAAELLQDSDGNAFVVAHEPVELDDQEPTGDEEAMSQQDFNEYVLKVCRSDGTEVVTLSTLASGMRWSVCLQAGGDKVRNAYLGNKSDPLVWLNTWDHEVSRDDDGAYCIYIDQNNEAVQA